MLCIYELTHSVRAHLSSALYALAGNAMRLSGRYVTEYGQAQCTWQPGTAILFEPTPPRHHTMQWTLLGVIKD